MRLRPAGITRVVAANIAETLNSEPTTDLMGRPASMRGYMTQETPFGDFKTLAYLGFAAATAWDWLSSDHPDAREHALCLLSLLCVTVDQVAVDGGSWTMAKHFLVIPEPPWAHISRKASPHQGPFSRLSPTLAGARR